LQERQESDKTISTVSHQNKPWYIINTHAFHNAMKLRKLLPDHLTKPKHLYPNRHQRHREIAKTLVVTQAEKKAETVRKAAETRARKAAKKAGLADNEGTPAAIAAVVPIPPQGTVVIPRPGVPVGVPETLHPILQQVPESREDINTGGIAQGGMRFMWSLNGDASMEDPRGRKRARIE
jgi:hypothetical protein